MVLQHILPQVCRRRVRLWLWLHPHCRQWQNYTHAAVTVYFGLAEYTHCVRVLQVRSQGCTSQYMSCRPPLQPRVKPTVRENVSQAPEDREVRVHAAQIRSGLVKS